MKPHLTFKAGFWYCHGPEEPSNRILSSWGEYTPRMAYLEYVTRCEYRAGMPAEIAA